MKQNDANVKPATLTNPIRRGHRHRAVPEARAILPRSTALKLLQSEHRDNHNLHQRNFRHIYEQKKRTELPTTITQCAHERHGGHTSHRRHALQFERATSHVNAYRVCSHNTVLVEFQTLFRTCWFGAAACSATCNGVPVPRVEQQPQRLQRKVQKFKVQSSTLWR